MRSEACPTAGQIIVCTITIESDTIDSIDLMGLAFHNHKIHGPTADTSC